MYVCMYVIYVSIEVHTSGRPYLYNRIIPLMSILFTVKKTDICVEEHFG